MTNSGEGSRSFSAAVEQFEDRMAEICRLYGVNPLSGRLYAALFAAHEPMSLAQLSERVGAAKSTTSVLLRRLLSLRLVRRVPARSSRRDFYEAVSDLWGVLRDWNQSWFQPEIEMWQRSSAQLEHALAARDAPPPDARAPLLRRIEAIRKIAALAATLLAELPPGSGGGGRRRKRAGGRARGGAGATAPGGRAGLSGRRRRSGARAPVRAPRRKELA